MFEDYEHKRDNPDFGVKTSEDSECQVGVLNQTRTIRETHRSGKNTFQMRLILSPKLQMEKYARSVKKWEHCYESRVIRRRSIGTDVTVVTKHFLLGHEGTEKQLLVLKHVNTKHTHRSTGGINTIQNQLRG